MVFPIDVIKNFLENEGLTPYRVLKDDGDDWAININEPWGEEDHKFRCGFSCQFNEKAGKRMVLFNSWRAVVHLGDDFKGSFEKFVKLYKGFSNRREARMWFLRTYMYHDLRAVLEEEHQHREWEAPEILEPKECVLPEVFEPLNWKNAAHSPYYQYLLGRGITRERLGVAPVYIDPERSRVVFPVIEDNKIIFWTGRSIKEKTPLPWLNVTISDTRPIWGLNQCGPEPIVTEAVFDALSAPPPDGIAILGAGNVADDEIADKIARRKFVKIRIAMDNDDPGIKSKIRLAQKLTAREQRVEIYDFSKIQQTDFNNMLRANVDFEFEKRMIPWSTKTEMLIKMKKIK